MKPAALKGRSPEFNSGNPLNFLNSFNVFIIQTRDSEFTGSTGRLRYHDAGLPVSRNTPDERRNRQDNPLNATIPVWQFCRFRTRQ